MLTPVFSLATIIRKYACFRESYVLYHNNIHVEFICNHLHLVNLGKIQYGDMGYMIYIIFYPLQGSDATTHLISLRVQNEQFSEEKRIHST